MDVDEEVKFFVKIRGGGGIRADVNEEFKLLWKCKKNIGGGGVRSGRGWGGSRDGGWSIRGLVGSNVGGRG